MAEQRRRFRFPVRTAAFVGVVLVIGGLAALIDFSPDLEHLRVRVLSGAEQGNYYAVVDRLQRAAARRGGRVVNVSSAGTVDNLQQLVDHADDCEVQFALAQDGVPAPDGAELELVGRLPRRESVLLLGRDAGAITRFDQLAGATIGIGPAGSGTDHLARAILESDALAPLGLRLVNLPIAEQLERVQRGELALGLFVVDQDAALVRDAVRTGGLQLAALDHARALAERYEFASAATIPAGYYDPVRVLPPADRQVLQVDTLILGNGCAGRSDEMALLSALAAAFPGFVAHNRGGGPSAQFPPSPTATEFYDAGGPSWADRYLPAWIVDIMPPGDWFYVVAAISVLFNLLTGWHRFRLWRVDANRDKATQRVRDALGEQLTPAEIAELEPRPDHDVAALDRALAELDALRVVCRAQENSFLVPMGQEWAYRYQEEQMEAILTAVRKLRARARST